jgi:hypothetical protein
MARKSFAAFAVLSLLGAGRAQASLLVDFTDASWSAAHGLTSHIAPVGGVFVEVLKSGGAPGDKITFSLFDGSTSLAPCPPLACFGDGLGIGNTASSPDDEVTVGGGLGVGETLSVRFWADAAGTVPLSATIHTLHFLDLFKGAAGAVDPSNEVAEWVYLDALGMPFGGGSLTGVLTNATGTGYATIGSLGVDAYGVAFFTTAPANSDFSPAALEIAPVPEPGGFLAVGLGLLAVVVRQRLTR